MGWHKLRLELCFRARLQPCRKRGNLNEGFSPRGMLFRREREASASRIGRFDSAGLQPRAFPPNTGPSTQMLYSQVGKTAIMNGQALKSSGLSDAGPVFIPLPGGETAIYNSSGTLADYRHADWLGSSRLTTTVSGSVSSSSAYAPFGEQYATSGTTDASFTGQNSDTNSGLYDFTFREYSSSQGRWASPDPAGVAAANLSSPQSWNRYAYVQNNPMRYVDPLGLMLCSYGLNEDGTPDNEDADTVLECTSNDGTVVEDEQTVVVSGDYDSLLPDASYGVYWDSYSVSIYGYSGGGSGSAPNNAPTNPRATQCKIKVGVGIGLDVAGTAAGLVPGAGAALVTTQVSLGLASAAYSAYNGSAAFTIGNATGAQLSAVAAGAEYVGWKTAAKALPWIGTLYNAGALAYDVYHAQSDYQACLAGG